MSRPLASPTSTPESLVESDGPVLPEVGAVVVPSVPEEPPEVSPVLSA
ncbi:hypothetical protein [Nannocystis pusilla]